MPTDQKNSIGFAGLGTMGRPIALNMLESGVALTVWNRTIAKTHDLQAAGARVAGDTASLFARCETVVLMLASAEAVDSVLERGTDRFAEFVGGRLIVNMGTTTPSYSRDLDRDLRAAGARYVEAPVSGQKVRAEKRLLVGLLAGDPADIDAAKPIVSLVCSDTVVAGKVPAATDAKFGLSVYQGTAMAALAEAVNYARHSGVALDVFSALLRSGPLYNQLMEVQLRKFAENDFSVEGSVARVAAVVQPILEEAASRGISVPLLSRSGDLYAEALTLSDAEQDVTSVVQVFERASRKR